ncbi:MAG TPA: carboxypeptidase-like regulatory domain-containing protein, partial [Gemmatimonadales bacterium]|nr:carboxypeptidase-like regulatory domain-containing protein [Gemmatimonadales bacterium]
MLTRTLVRWLGGALVAVATLFLAPVPVSAQTSTGTIRGYITNQDNSPIAGAEIQAKNVESGVTRSATSGTDGGYTMPGLVPAVYQLSVRHIGSAPQTRQVRVQIGATALENFKLTDQAVELEEVTAVAAAPAVETRTSEVATNISQQQINDLPTPNRNIFDLAALAPGVVTQGDQIGGTRRTFSSGAASADPRGADQVNVFIDGASYKNDLLRGGVV